MFQSAIFDSEQEAHDFEARLLGLLHAGDAEQAAMAVQGHLDSLDGGDHPVAGICRKATAESVSMTGWHQLARMPRSATAVQFDVSDHYEGPPAPEGYEPVIETSFYSDGAGDVEFSTMDRKSLVARCGRYDVPWQGQFDDIVGSFEISGLACLNGAIRSLSRLRQASDPTLSPADHDAWRLGDAFIAISLYRSVERAIRLHGLPRPVTVLIGSNEARPFFNAPVLTREEYEATKDDRPGFKHPDNEPFRSSEDRNRRRSFDQAGARPTHPRALLAKVGIEKLSAALERGGFNADAVARTQETIAKLKRVVEADARASAEAASKPQPQRDEAGFEKMRERSSTAPDDLVDLVAHAGLTAMQAAEKNLTPGQRQLVRAIAADLSDLASFVRNRRR